jgi:hypothetical protein
MRSNGVSASRPLTQQFNGCSAVKIGIMRYGVSIEFEKVTLFSSYVVWPETLISLTWDGASDGEQKCSSG